MTTEEIQAVQERLGLSDGKMAMALGITRQTWRNWRSLAGDAGLNAEECARIMNHAYGSKVEADHYDRGENAAIKLAAMAKWEKALSAMIG